MLSGVRVETLDRGLHLGGHVVGGVGVTIPFHVDVEVVVPHRLDGVRDAVRRDRQQVGELGLEVPAWLRWIQPGCRQRRAERLRVGRVVERAVRSASAEGTESDDGQGDRDVLQLDAPC